LVTKAKPDTRVIRKVKETQHQNPEFDHTQGEIPQKNTCKKVHQHSTGDETQKTINSILVAN
jgi:hypothetical protein